jgi:hypothetical protein
MTKEKIIEILNKYVDFSAYSRSGADKDILNSIADELLEEDRGQGEETCPDCGGDGKETCNNPDHGFYAGMTRPGSDEDRIGCPCCGHDPNYKVPNGGKCERCNGTGKIKSAPSSFDFYKDEDTERKIRLLEEAKSPSGDNEVTAEEFLRTKYKDDKWEPTFDNIAKALIEFASLKSDTPFTSANYMKIRELTDEEWMKLPKEEILQLYKNCYKMLIDQVKSDNEEVIDVSDEDIEDIITGKKPHTKIDNSERIFFFSGEEQFAVHAFYLWYKSRTIESKKSLLMRFMESFNLAEYKHFADIELIDEFLESENNKNK